MKVLGVEVPRSLVDSWRDWFAPAVQPFFVRRSDANGLPSIPKQRLSPEWRDTFEVWNVQRDLQTVWLDEMGFESLPRTTRIRLVRSQVECGRGAVPTVRAWADLLDRDTLRSQADSHRFVWWPSLLGVHARTILERIVAHDGAASRHAEVGAGTWRRAAHALPRAPSRSASSRFLPARQRSQLFRDRDGGRRCRPGRRSVDAAGAV